MKCNDCTDLLDQLLEDELDPRLEGEVTEHLGNCRNCDAELDRRRSESVIYAQFFCDIAPAEDLSARFRERLSTEFGDRKSSVTPRPRRSIADLIAAFGLSPSLAAAAILLLIGVFLFAARTENDRIGLASAIDERPPFPEMPRLAAKPTEIANPDQKFVPIGDREIRRTRSESTVVKTNNRRPPRVRTPQSEDPDAVRMQAIAELQAFESEVSKQVEKVELMLRSFRNARISDETETYEVSYERDQARTLLNANAALREKARFLGSAYVIETLERVEPYLLDIANLDRSPSPGDVLEIKRRMRDQSVIASLQVF